MKKDERVFRAVSLRKDEAAALEREAASERFECCPHLDRFHNHGTDIYGRRWKSCQLGGAGGCSCNLAKPVPKDVIDEYERRKKVEKSQERENTIALLFIGSIVGMVVTGISIALISGG